MTAEALCKELSFLVNTYIFFLLKGYTCIRDNLSMDVTSTKEDTEDRTYSTRRGHITYLYSYYVINIRMSIYRRNKKYVEYTQMQKCH